MNKFWKWFFIVLGALIVIGIAFGITLFFVRGGFANYPAYGMMGSFGRQPRLFGGMMLGMGLGMLFRGLFGLGILVLAGFGVAYLVKRPAHPAMTPPPAMPVCANCGSPLAPDWKACPHCGKEVKSTK
jgi:hypothetical protein